MSELLLWTDTQAQTDRIYLDTLGSVKSLTFSTGFPGGALNLGAALAFRPARTHRALTPGRLCGITCGGVEVWLGTLTQPEPAEDGTLNLNATGDGSVLSRFVAFSNNHALGVYSAATIIDQAKTNRGSPIGRDAAVALPILPGAYAPDGSMMIDEVLTAIGDGVGKRWRVDLDRLVRFYPLTGAVGERLVLRARTNPGRTVEDFFTTIFLVYTDAGTALRVAAKRSVPAAIRDTVGARERAEDVTGDGTYTAAQAQAMLARLLDKQSAAPGYAGTFEATFGDLRTEGGSSVDLATVRAGAFVTVIGVDPTSGLYAFSADDSTFTLGETSYDADAGILTLTPAPGGTTVSAAS